MSTLDQLDRQIHHAIDQRELIRVRQVEAVTGEIRAAEGRAAALRADLRTLIERRRDAAHSFGQGEAMRVLDGKIAEHNRALHAELANIDAQETQAEHARQGRTPDLQAAQVRIAALESQRRQLAHAGAAAGLETASSALRQVADALLQAGSSPEQARRAVLSAAGLQED
jgi:chromosome segregation ATPase